MSMAGMDARTQTRYHMGSNTGWRQRSRERLRRSATSVPSRRPTLHWVLPRPATRQART